MKIIISIAAFLFLLFNAPAQQADYQQLKAEAERAYVQGSYSRANEIYGRVDKKGLGPAEVRWVEFRLADTEWRAQAATTTSDNTKLELAQNKLAELIRTNEKDEDRDLVWAEAHESLGDFYWTRRGQMNWGGAWPHYQQALDWWAGQREIEPARQRYLRIVFKAASPPNQDQYYYYSYYGNYIPLPILENALKISTTESDRARLHFIIAMTMRNSGGDWESRQRVGDEFEEALKVRQSEYYDDALFNYAEWMNSNGTIVQLPNGQWQQEVDYIKALELYRRLLREFKKGETRYYDQAQQQIKNITEPSLGVGVSNIFLPESETQFGLNARNLKRVDFALYKIDLTRDVRFTPMSEEDEGETDSGDNSWIQKIPTGTLPSIKTWSKTLDLKGDHKPVNEQIRIDAKLSVGAYLIEARSGSLAARDLVLVTDASLVLKSSAKQALAFFSHALTGAPIANASVALWESYYNNGKWHWRRYRQTTNADGLAMFTLKDVTNSRNLFAAASSTSGANVRQAFVNAYANGYGASGDPWRIYAFTDRPAYRPKETVQWKFIARRFGNGVYTTPANQVVEYQITDPRGAKVSEGKATLNDFGSAWGSVELTEQLPLGEYNIQFWDAGRANGIGNAKLFRLEEYKLPEFKVAVKTPEQDGKKKAFRLGEQVEVDIQADYYFGGPVSNASVEVVVYQAPFYHYWHPYRDYGWYYDDIERLRRPYYYGQGQVVKRETIKTDASGKATLTFDTPRENYNQDFEYRVEARVTDSSRREIVASDTVRVTRQRYYVYPRAQRNIYRPGDKVTFDIKALDANEQPVTTEGTVRITRDYWWEVWIDPTGREVKGEELRLLRARGEPFPPVSKTGKRWRLKFRGYEHEEILTQSVKTDAEGKAQVTFTPQREGYFRLAWESSQKGTAKRDRFLPPIKAETAVFVANNRSTDLGYRYSGVEIVVDKDTVRAGETAPVMLFVSENVASGSNGERYVLFSVEGEDLYSYRLVRMTGTAKLIEVPIEEKHVPNIWLSAAMVSDAQLHVDTKQIVVPPVDRFLSIDVKADREQYQPREEGTLTVTAKDVNGRPVSAEIALGLVDESVKYIQQDYAGDPRQFYYGTKRSQMVQTQSTFNQKSYIRLFDNGKGQLTSSATRDEDEQDSDRKEENNFARGRFGNLSGADSSGPANAVTVTSESAILTDGISARRIQDLPTNGRAAKSMGFLRADNEPPPPPGPGQDPAVQVRSDFRSTIFWQPDVRTDADGTAVVKVKYPDSLTTWSATARAASSGNQFGIGNTTTRTKQPLIVRLQSPRFFVVGDQVTVSAVINNNTEETMSVSSALHAEGVTVGGLVVDGKPVKGELGPVQVKAGSEARVDWLVAVNSGRRGEVKS